MAVSVTVHIINHWKIISTSANASVDIIFLGLIISTVTLTAMCYLYIIIPHLKFPMLKPYTGAGVIPFDRIVILPAIKGRQLSND